MASIRGQLATAYGATLIATVLVVGGLVYDIALETQREMAVRQLESRARTDDDVALRIIGQTADSGSVVSKTQTLLHQEGSVAAPSLRRALEGVPDYVVILDSAGEVLYNSFDVRQLNPDDRFELALAANQLPLDTLLHPIKLEGRQLLVAVGVPFMPGTTSRVPGVARVVAGVAIDSDVVSTALLTTDLLLLPVIVILSLWAAYAVSGRAFRPIDVIINEVEAITDGRSLHRRLVVDGAGDEMRRLSETLNQMIARLESSFGALRRFTADASHELKTPLAVLRADVERALTTPSHSTDQLVALEEALQETRRMADLVDSLLTLARADEGRYDMIREPVALDPLVREVFESATILGEDAELTVSLLVLEPATVLGDATRLRQLFMNLVMNAIKYTPRGGRVEISLSHRLDGVTFSVRDTGVGIAPSDLPHIFERFWRADRARSRASERGGFGLGLAISQWIAQAHGGSIVATSRLGRGSMFTVHLPTAGTEAGDGVVAPATTVPSAASI
jgi:two-component system, OmpR family, sensor kinase